MLLAIRASVLGFFVVGLLLGPASEVRSEQVPATPADGESRLGFISELGPGRLGADRQGNLWSWDRTSSAVEIFDPDGVRVVRLQVPVSRSLDVDRSWGVVGTAADGSTLHLVSNDGASRVIHLDNDAAHVAWIDGKAIALSTTRASESIEIWDVDRGVLLRSFGSVEEIVPRVGAVLLRSLILRYSAPRKTLFALDSVNGTLESWSVKGDRLRTDIVPAHRRTEIEKWLADFDLKAKAEGQSHTPFYEILRLTVDTEGSAWVVESCSPNRQRASLVKVSSGPAAAFQVDLEKPCCSNNFIVWNDYFVSAVTARQESPGCAAWRKLP